MLCVQYVWLCDCVCLNCVCPATEPGEGGLSFRLCGMSSNLWVGRVVEWMQWPAAFPFPTFLLKQGSPSLQIYEDTWICSFPISLFPQLNTSQSTITVSKFVKVCDYYAELSCIAMNYERSHVEMCAVVISFANIYICLSFFRSFHKYKTYRC